MHQMIVSNEFNMMRDRQDALRHASLHASLWRRVNLTCLAKSLSELAYEEAFHPEEEAGGLWIFRFGDVHYRCEGEPRIWGQLTIDPDSIIRIENGEESQAHDAAQFFVDAQAALGMSDATLAMYLQELYATLQTDMELLRRRDGLSAISMLDLDNDRLQARLDGHPKAPASKGRVGWGFEDQRAYAPEYDPVFRLHWIAVAREACLGGMTRDISEDDLLSEMLRVDDLRQIDRILFERGFDRISHRLIPVHPWQWQNYIQTHFAADIASGRIVPLGERGDLYRPQQSLRTLANAERAAAHDIKLPVTILNTSAWRGLPGKGILTGVGLSSWLSECIAKDAVFQTTKVLILRDMAGYAVPQTVYGKIAQAPYRFHELLGAVWRQRAEPSLAEDERAIMLGALQVCGGDGVPLISACIRRSSMPCDIWLERLFSSVVVPLYHLMCRYGAGFIAHGQNVTLLLKDWVPCGVALKDLQGDFDLVTPALPEHETLPEGLADQVGRRPAEHLIHHLQTGHFVSVLRFLSDALLMHDGYPEQAFYQGLARVIRQYQARCPELAGRFEMFDLFTPTMMRICINRARFSIGYGDTPVRPKPEIGTPLHNPLYDDWSLRSDWNHSLHQHAAFQSGSMA
ncbi:Aerobactin siderophore biosynthesis protein iucC [Granulibacter bethesdensis CGDNIH4]|nr:Aerobactin siderophore biosynthesis protein iucC [Granulibacter bethesdensis CGDNIH4]